MSNTNHTVAPIVAVFTPQDAEAIRAAMANHPAVLSKHIAPVIDLAAWKASR